MNTPVLRTEIKKIAVLRANAVGDYIVALPALEALRSRYPDAEIVLLGRHWHADFLADRPGPVDRTITLPYVRGIYDPPESQPEDPAALESFYHAASAEAFDLVFQLHGGGRYSNPVVRSLGAGMTIGARTPDAMPLDRWLPYRVFQNEALRLLEIVSLTGAAPRTLEPRLAVTARDLREAGAVVPDDGRPLVVMNPGSRDPRRRWPAGKFAAVADQLCDMGGRIVINGDGGDASAVEEMKYRMRNQAQSVCGKLSLRGLAGLLSRARLLVTNDSGPFHLAVALGTPVVAVFWCGNVHTYCPMSCRNAVLHIAWRMHCPVCGSDCMGQGCLHQDSFVADIPVEEVFASARDLFPGASIEP